MKGGFVVAIRCVLLSAQYGGRGEDLSSFPFPLLPRDYAAFSIFPVRIHRVQTFLRRMRPLSTTRTFWIFGRQTRFVFRWEWLTLFPTTGLFPHTEQILDMGPYPSCPDYVVWLLHWAF